VRATTRVIGALALAAMAAAAAGCGGDDAGNDCRGVERGEAALFGAGPDAGSDQVDGVVALIAQTSARSGELCSGALFAPDMVLTARHCIERAGASSVLVGAAIQDAEQVLPIDYFYADEDRDLAIAVLTAGAIARGREPSVIPLGLQDELAIGERATLAGFGLDEDGNIGERRFVDEPIVQLDDELVVVDGAGKSGACVGDSGGPLLIRRDGELRVAGVLSGGSSSCTDLDVYQRVTPVADWLREAIDEVAAERGETSRDGC
jgi:hypothetical protein